jgi:hypothetical protein
MESTVTEVLPSTVSLKTPHGGEEIDNDAIIVCAGGILPNGFLESIGVQMKTAHGEPL